MNAWLLRTNTHYLHKPHTEIGVQTYTTTTTNDSNILEQHVSPVTDKCIESVSSKSPLSCTTNKKDLFFKHFYIKSRHYIRCTPCYEEPNLIKKYTNKLKISAIAQVSGIIYREKIVSEHVSTLYHIEAVKVNKLKSLNTSDKMAIPPMGKAINYSNEKLAKKIGTLLIHVYNDAKKLTLSAYSFPSRVVVSLRANSFCTNGEMTDTMDENELQYLTPHSHYDFLQCIVESHRSSFVEEILNDSFAFLLRCDGSVDCTQIDKMMNSISLKGEEKLYFLGAAEPIERGAKGMYDALKTACINILGTENFNKI